MRSVLTRLRTSPSTKVRHDRVVEAPQALVGEVADAGRERQADQVVGAEQQVGEPGGVGGVLGDGELAVPVGQGEDLVEGEQPFADLGGDDLGPVGGVVVGHRGEHRDAFAEPEVAGQGSGVEGLDLDGEALAVGGGEGAVAPQAGGRQPVMVVDDGVDGGGEGVVAHVPGGGVGDLVTGQARGSAITTGPRLVAWARIAAYGWVSMAGERVGP